MLEKSSKRLLGNQAEEFVKFENLQSLGGQNNNVNREINRVYQEITTCNVLVYFSAQKESY